MGHGGLDLSTDRDRDLVVDTRVEEGAGGGGLRRIGAKVPEESRPNRSLREPKMRPMLAFESRRDVKRAPTKG